MIGDNISIRLANIDRINGGFYITYADENSPPVVTYNYAFRLDCNVTCYDTDVNCELVIRNVSESDFMELISSEIQLDVEWKTKIPEGFAASQMLAALKSYKCRNQIKLRIKKFEKLYKKEFLNEINKNDLDYLESERKLNEKRFT